MEKQENFLSSKKRHVAADWDDLKSFPLDMNTIYSHKDSLS